MIGPKQLGGSKLDVWTKYFDQRVKARNPADAEKYADPIERLVIGFLSKLGINYPIDFILPSPNNYTGGVARQGRITLDPAGGPRASSSLTWKAKDKGFLVIKCLDIIAEDPIAEASLQIIYRFGDVVNSVNFQIDKSAVEPGRWKFSCFVLADEDELTVELNNLDLFASAEVSFQSDQWML